VRDKGFGFIRFITQLGYRLGWFLSRNAQIIAKYGLNSFA